MVLFPARIHTFLPLFCLFLCSTAIAHESGPHTHGFEAGVLHPLTGIDHLLAMVAVGLWAVQLGGRARWLMPLVFVGAMAPGGALGFSGLALPFVEAGILASVLILGALIARASKLPPRAALPLVALFALFHGLAHGAELPAQASEAAYAAGFLVSTALLHATGVLAALGLERLKHSVPLRCAGGAIAAAALLLFVRAF